MSVTPTAPTDADLQRLIVLEVGDADDKRLSRNISLLWSLYTNAGSQTMQYLLARRHAIQMVMGAVRELIDINAAGEVNVSWSQRIGNLKVMLDATQAEIDAIASGGGVGGNTGAGTLELGPVTETGIPVGNLNYLDEEPEVTDALEDAAVHRAARLAYPLTHPGSRGR
jgi:hypothetical protein